MIRRKKQQTGEFKFRPYMIIIGLLAVAITYIIGYRASISEHRLFSVSLLALFAGLLFESFRISDNRWNVIYRFIGAYLLSFFSFLPGKREHNYDFEVHIQIWPYFVMAFFALATVVFDKDKVTAKLTEGITLLLSVSLIYWVLDSGIMEIDNWFMKLLIILLALFSAFSILNAFTYIKLSPGARLILSIWSTLIVVAFAIDNILRVFDNQDIESTKYLSEGVNIGVQYFLLGVSGVYIIQNFMLLAGFIPDKSGNYRKQLSDTVYDHVNRYSDDQVHIGSSLFCVVYAGFIYMMNFYYHFLPRYTIVWFVIATFPLLLWLIRRLVGSRI